MSSYTIGEYGDMVNDRNRTNAYSEAIRARVNSDSVVLDLGAGPGIFTLMACQAGARKVYAVDADGIIQVARELVAANGFCDRVELIQAMSTSVNLPEKVDLIVSDLHGVLPFHQVSVRSILDARDRFLKPGGTLIPQTETLRAALVSAPMSYRRIVEPWENTRGLDWRVGRRRAVNTWKQWSRSGEALVSEPQTWVVLEYARLDTPNARGTLRWTVAEACEAHGFCLWFDCETTAGCVFSNAPGVGEQSVYRQAFFPWSQPCALVPDSVVVIDVRADLVGEDYIWTWNTDIHDSRDADKRVSTFRQSTFLSAPLSTDWVRKASAAFVPSPNEEASIDSMIMDLLFQGITLQEISSRVSDRFGDRFPEWKTALTRVADLSLRYSK